MDSRAPRILQPEARDAFIPALIEATPARGRAKPRILSPGRNLWRLEPASRAAFLVDSDTYYRALDGAFRLARRSIWILGWDFNADICLRRDEEAERVPLGRLLRSLVERHPALEIRVLIWQLGALYSQKISNRSLEGEWSDHPRIHFRLDGRHPLRASHHQKLVCIDDALAFAGGIDLTVRRWDTSEHLAGDPIRIDPDGLPYPPVHDIQMAVEGDAAAALGDLARQRWQIATGEELSSARPGSACWPAGLAPDLADTQVAIARTRPPHYGRASRREAARLNRDALAAAQGSIYIETQYFASWSVGRILARRLREEHGPEVVIVATVSARGLLERFVMGGNRDRLIRRLKKADRFHRLRVLYAVVPAEDGREQEVQIHAKLVVVDDRFLRIGSSNLNNRSEGLDTECDLAVEAGTEDERRSIAGLRDRLLAEHLGSTPAAVGSVVARTGSLLQAIDRLNTGARGLRRLRTGSGATEPVPGTGLLDPERPWWPMQWLRERILHWVKKIPGVS